MAIEITTNYSGSSEHMIYCRGGSCGRRGGSELTAEQEMDRIFDVLGLLTLSGGFTFIDIHNNEWHSLPTKSNANENEHLKGVRRCLNIEADDNNASNDDIEEYMRVVMRMQRFRLRVHRFAVLQQNLYSRATTTFSAYLIFCQQQQQLNNNIFE